MLRKLLSDTAITAAAFFVASIVGLLLVPVLIGAYGVGGLGLIVLARILVPAGALGILDFGLSEIATQSVAMARAAGEWAVAKARLRLLAILAAVLVVVVALATCALAAQINQWFKVPAEDQADFARLIKGTAIALPVLFAGLVFEGVIKGFEKFSVLRTTEIVSTLAYAALVLIGIRLGKDFTWVAWSFLAMQVGRALGFGVIALRMLPAGKGGPIDVAVRQYVLERGRLLFTSRMLGNVQHQAPTLLIAVLVGPTAVGIYDTILRLPRFAKSALSIIGTTLMPAAMRLDAAGDHDRLQAIGRVLISVLPTLILPPIAALAIFSGDVVNLWLGPDFVAHAPWLAAYLLVPALNTLVSFQHSTLMNRPEYLRANNRIAVVQTLVQMGLSLVLVRWMAQNAFILGQVVATLCVFVSQIQLGHSYLHPPPQLRSRFFAFVVAILLGVTACVVVLPAPVLSSAVAATIAGACFVAVIWLLAVRYFLTAEGRGILRAVVRIASRPFVKSESQTHPYP